MAIVDKLVTVSRDPCLLPDYTQPIVSSIALPTCDLSHSFDRNWELNKVPALVLILSSMTQMTTVLAQIVVDAIDSVDLAIHIQQVSRAIDIWGRLIPHLRLLNIADAFLVVAFQAKTMRLAQHMRYNWWVVSIKDCSDPCSCPTFRLDVHVRQSDASAYFVMHRNVIAMDWAMN